MECHHYCCAEKIDLNKVETFYKQASGMNVVKHWNALEVSQSQNQNVLYVFQNGTVISWGFKKYQIKAFLKDIIPFCLSPIKKPIHESFYYSLGSKFRLQPHPYFNFDCIVLENDEKDVKLSISYALAQSIKCQYYEDTLEVLIGKYSPIVTELSTTGWFKVSRNKIRMIIGEILFAKSQLNLTYNFLYRPKFFWRHPNLEAEYNMVESYMEIPVRAQVINHRLNALNEIAVLCSDFLETKQAHFLEIVIILLIALAIMQSMFDFHF